jgi:hypothetical protein
VTRLPVTSQTGPLLDLEMLGDERIDAELERFGEGVSEYLRRSRIPENDLAGMCLRNDDRVSYALKEPADP